MFGSRGSTLGQSCEPLVGFGRAKRARALVPLAGQRLARLNAQYGQSRELPRVARKEKRPEIVVSDAFEFERFSRRPKYSLAQSLYTHLIPNQIELCLANLRAYVPDEHEAYATFQVGDSAANPSADDDAKRFRYTPEELAAIGERTGWRSEYIGEWGHPRGQVMMRFLTA